MWEEEKIILVPLEIFEKIVLNRTNQIVSNGDNKIYMKNKILKTTLYLLVAVLVGFTASYAGNLVPPSSPSNTMYSLEDIYNLATDSITAEEGEGDIPETPGTVSSTGVTLTEVYEAVASALANTGSPDLTWQTDPALNLCWSYDTYEIESGNCSVGSGFVQTPDTNTTLGATEYCQYLEADGETLANTAQNIWHLPTIEEYQSITDYTLYNNATEVPGFAEDTIYWSSTESAEYPNGAWDWYSWGGYTSNYDKSDPVAVRCARLAPPAL